MPTWQTYLQPTSLAEALQCLQAAPGRTKIIAGGSDLLIDIQQGRHPPVETLVDVTGIPELRALRVEDNHLFLGAALTHYEIVSSPLLRQHASALVEASALIGGPQVRNLATIGGNVAHGLPAGDGTIALLALDAQAQLAGPQGVRWLPLEELFLGPGHTILSAGQELLLGFRLPLLRPGEGSAFWRVMRPQGVAIAILNMGAWLRVDSATGLVEDIRLAAGPAGPKPFRARRTEAVLRDRARRACWTPRHWPWPLRHSWPKPGCVPALTAPAPNIAATSSRWSCVRCSRTRWPRSGMLPGPRPLIR